MHCTDAKVKYYKALYSTLSLCLFSLSSSNISESLLAMHPSDVLDMPVDPNEPTYCLCSQVSYGEMIGCDNSDVSNNVCVCVCVCNNDYIYIISHA